MEETAKAIAVENKWLFFEIDASEIMLKFMHGTNINLKVRIVLIKFQLIIYFNRQLLKVRTQDLRTYC